jgi:hypothetical protein
MVQVGTALPACLWLLTVKLAPQSWSLILRELNHSEGAAFEFPDLGSVLVASYLGSVSRINVDTLWTFRVRLKVKKR